MNAGRWLLLLGISLFILPSSLKAQTNLYWSGGVDELGGDGDWHYGTANWKDGVGDLQPYPIDGLGEGVTAVFNGIGGNVTVTNAITFAALSFVTAGYTISGSGDYGIHGGTTTSVEVFGADTEATVQASFLGTGVLEKKGEGTLYLTGTNSIQQLSVTAGRVVASAGSLNYYTPGGSTLPFDPAELVSGFDSNHRVTASGATAVVELAAGFAGTQVFSLKNGGTLENRGTIHVGNGGPISSEDEVSEANLINWGAIDTIPTNAPLPRDRTSAVIFYGESTVVNHGTIEAENIGIIFNGGGTITNEEGATITGDSDRAISGSRNVDEDAPVVAVDVTNRGTLYGGVSLRTGGTVTNEATGKIDGGATGSGVNGQTMEITLYNSGEIKATGAAVSLNAGGTIENEATGWIEGTAAGQSVGVVALDGGSVTNSGTIKGGLTGVLFTNGGFLSNEKSGVINGFLGAHPLIATPQTRGVEIINKGQINGDVVLGKFSNDVSLIQESQIDGDLTFDSTATVNKLTVSVGTTAGEPNVQLHSDAVTGTTDLKGGTFIKQGVGKDPLTDGGGTWIIDKAIANSSAVEVHDGTLQIGNGDVDGSIDGTFALDANTHLIVNKTNDLSIVSVISGDGDFRQAGSGLTKLSANSTYTGDTFVDKGTLKISNVPSVDGDSATGTGTVYVADGATLSGNGSVGDVVVNGTLSPGDGTARLTTGDASWEKGGNYLWEINSAKGQAGELSGWDLISSTKLTLDATLEGTPFVIYLTSLGTLTDFDLNADYEWTIATAGSIVGFSSSKFSLDIDGFKAFNSISPTGLFSIEQDGKNLNIVYSANAVPEPSVNALLVIGLGLGWMVLRRRNRAASAC